MTDTNTNDLVDHAAIREAEATLGSLLKRSKETTAAIPLAATTIRTAEAHRREAIVAGKGLDAANKALAAAKAKYAETVEMADLLDRAFVEYQQQTLPAARYTAHLPLMRATCDAMLTLSEKSDALKAAQDDLAEQWRQQVAIMSGCPARPGGIDPVRFPPAPLTADKMIAARVSMQIDVE